MLVHQSRCAIVQTTLRESSIFSSLRKAQNLDSSKGLVKISTSCFAVLTWRISISPLVSWSLKKWCRMSMCLVLEWLTGLFASFMALSLLHKSGILVNTLGGNKYICRDEPFHVCKQNQETNFTYPWRAGQQFWNTDNAGQVLCYKPAHSLWNISFSLEKC